jgi:transcriptional regulator with XRE-family HTH domain
MNLQLKLLRVRAGLSQDEIAERLGIKTSRYGTWERGERMMSLEQACQVAEVLGCTLEELVGRASPGEAQKSASADPSLNELNDCWEAASDSGRGTMLDVARAMRATTPRV